MTIWWMRECMQSGVRASLGVSQTSFATNCQTLEPWFFTSAAWTYFKRIFFCFKFMSEMCSCEDKTETWLSIDVNSTAHQIIDHLPYSGYEATGFHLFVRSESVHCLVLSLTNSLLLLIETWLMCLWLSSQNLFVTITWQQFVSWTKSSLLILACLGSYWQKHSTPRSNVPLAMLKFTKAFPSTWIIFNGGVDKATFNFTNHTLPGSEHQSSINKSNPKVQMFRPHRALFKSWQFYSFYHCNHPCLVWCFLCWSFLNGLFLALIYKSLK